MFALIYSIFSFSLSCQTGFVEELFIAFNFDNLFARLLDSKTDMYFAKNDSKLLVCRIFSIVHIDIIDRIFNTKGTKMLLNWVLIIFAASFISFLYDNLDNLWFSCAC